MLDEDSIGQHSIRETLAHHQSAPQCASCHRRIDPLGFGLENFDAVGLWRDAVRAHSPESGLKNQAQPRESNENGSSTSDAATVDPVEFSINAHGVMPDGVRRFNGPAELKVRLMENKEEFIRGFTEALMTYALGRTPAFSDRPHIETILESARKHRYQLRVILKEIILSEAFMMRSP